MLVTLDSCVPTWMLFPLEKITASAVVKHFLLFADATGRSVYSEPSDLIFKNHLIHALKFLQDQAVLFLGDPCYHLTSPKPWGAASAVPGLPGGEASRVLWVMGY